MSTDAGTSKEKILLVTTLEETVFNVSMPNFWLGCRSLTTNKMNTLISVFTGLFFVVENNSNTVVNKIRRKSEKTNRINWLLASYKSSTKQENKMIKKIADN